MLAIIRHYLKSNLKQIYKSFDIMEEKGMNRKYLIHKKDIIHGKKLGITFGQHIGSGAYGHVYYCEYNSGRVALKTQKRNIFRKIKIESELEVTNILKNIPHKNVIQFLQVFDNYDESEYWVLMVWVDAQVMIEVLYRNHEPFEESLSKDYFRQLVAGLQFLHSLGIVHRDIKPDNMLIVANNDGKDIIKYIDFGFAKLVPVDSELNKLDTISSIDTEYKANCTSLLGTHPYMPPELLTRETAIYDAFKADIYSLGIVLYVMLFDKFPFHLSDVRVEFSDQKYFAQKLKESLIIRYPENSEVSENAKNLIENMICADSDQRYSLQQIIDSNWIKS